VINGSERCVDALFGLGGRQGRRSGELLRGRRRRDSVASACCVFARSENTALRRRHSIHSAGAGMSLVVTSMFLMSSPNHDRTVRIRIRQRPDQNRIEGFLRSSGGIYAVKS
jgi:hypothetical protein